MKRQAIIQMQQEDIKVY